MSYHFLSRATDARIHVSGSNLKELFQDALFGVLAVLKPIKSKKREENISRTITIKAPDVNLLLIDFLNQIIRYVYTESEVYTQLTFRTLNESFLEVDLSGYKMAVFTDDDKSVICRQVEIKKKKKGLWSTNIIFDT